MAGSFRHAIRPGPDSLVNLYQQLTKGLSLFDSKVNNGIRDSRWVPDGDSQWDVIVPVKILYNIAEPLWYNRGGPKEIKVV